MRDEGMERWSHHRHHRHHTDNTYTTPPLLWPVAAAYRPLVVTNASNVWACFFDRVSAAEKHGTKITTATKLPLLLGFYNHQLIIINISMDLNIITV